MNAIDQACDLLREGNLVAFPTETVYGLGADATNIVAVQKIFTAKGRPSTNPLIVHIADAIAAKRYVTTWPEAAEKLATHFWPGPLTLVLPKTENIVPLVTAGRSTVGLRVPNHPMALKLLEQFNGAIAAPSANRANHLSPTEAEHVRRELGDAVNLILDGGRCNIGIESTVLDLSTDRPTILRPGGVTRQQIEKIIGPVEIFSGSVDSAKSAVSPGQHEKHYSPLTPTFRFEHDRWSKVVNDSGTDWQNCVLVLHGTLESHSGIKTIQMPKGPAEYAATLYSTLRRLDGERYARIIVEMPPDSSAWIAVRDRLKRASVSI
jgi:L-threonylcarbamoyladenylate synthase